MNPMDAHLDRLEAESLYILREVAAQFRRPVLLYSVGKDSTVLLHLLKKAFHPARPPLPLLHIDSTFEFRETYRFRDAVISRDGLDLRVHVNEDGVRAGINPFVHGAALHTEVMRTQGLLQALSRGGYDCAIGGARRDEERARAKERVFSLRDRNQRWDPRRQRAEFWNLYNGRLRAGESMRVFPLSDWTELDVWLYIQREKIELPPLYFAAERPVVAREGGWIMVDDERLPLRPGERPAHKRVRFRTLGCYPLTGGIESGADSVDAIVAELRCARTSERSGRVIDLDPAHSMERKKLEGYF